MLKKLTLVNFRSHKHTVIEFSEGVNVIVGRGQAGKTNIKRALEWLCTNRPRGDKMHSHWCQKGDVTRVEVQTTEGYIIEISKAVGDSVEFRLQYPEGRQAHWAKTNSQVPDKVIEALNVCELNIQHQLDQPYLITAGTGEVSRAVNQAVDLDQADQWVTDINKRRKNNAATITTLAGQLDQTKTRLNAYEVLPATYDLIERAMHIRNALDKCKRESQNLDVMITKAEQAKVHLNRLAEVSTLDNLLGAALTTQSTLSKIEDTQHLVGQILQDIQESQQVLDNLTSCGILEQLIGRIDKIRDRRKDVTKKAVLCEKVILAADELDQCEADLTEESEVYVNMLDELGVCPTCFTPVDDETLDYVIEGLRGESL